MPKDLSDYNTCIVLHFTTNINENSLIAMCRAFFFSSKEADICTRFDYLWLKNTCLLIYITFL